MSPRIEQLREAVETAHKGKATHLESIPVREMFGDALVWEGVVESFSISGHPKAYVCYAWSFKDGPETRYVTVLDFPPITSPQTAVRAAIASKAQR
jgi:hypothetical protein